MHGDSHAGVPGSSRSPTGPVDMPTSLLFNKPFRVLSQFSPVAGKTTLADYIDQPGVYAAGRLDFDSEGLMLLTDDGALQARISNPRYKRRKSTWRRSKAFRIRPCSKYSRGESS